MSYTKLFIFICMIIPRGNHHTFSLLFIFFVSWFNTFKYYGLLIFPVASTTRLERIAATFI